jgi:hypothetical protein
MEQTQHHVVERLAHLALRFSWDWMPWTEPLFAAQPGRRHLMGKVNAAEKEVVHHPN